MSAKRIEDNSLEQFMYIIKSNGLKVDPQGILWVTLSGSELIFLYDTKWVVLTFGQNVMGLWFQMYSFISAK